MHTGRRSLGADLRFNSSEGRVKHDHESQARWLAAAETIAGSSAFQQLYRRRERVRWGLTAAALAVAGGFTACMCLMPGFLGAPMYQGTHVTWGAALTVVCLLLGVAIGAIYVFAAEQLLGTGELQDWSGHEP